MIIAGEAIVRYYSLHKRKSGLWHLGRSPDFKYWEILV